MRGNQVDYVKDKLLVGAQLLYKIKKLNPDNSFLFKGKVRTLQERTIIQESKNDLAHLNNDDLSDVILDLDYLGMDVDVIKLLLKHADDRKLFDSKRYPNNDDPTTSAYHLNVLATDYIKNFSTPSKNVEDGVNNTPCRGSISLCSGGPYYLTEDMFINKPAIKIYLNADELFEHNVKVIHKANNHWHRRLKYYGSQYGLRILCVGGAPGWD